MKKHTDKPVKETSAQTEKRNFNKGTDKKPEEETEQEAPKHGEYYKKNILYKYKDGHSCRVMYSEDTGSCVERIMLG